MFKAFVLLGLIAVGWSKTLDPGWERNVAASEGISMGQDLEWEYIPADWESSCQLCLVPDEHSSVIVEQDGQLDYKCLSADQMEKGECDWVVHAVCPGAYHCSDPFKRTMKRLFTLECDPTGDEDVHSLEEEAICGPIIETYASKSEDHLVNRVVKESPGNTSFSGFEEEEPLKRSISDYIYSDECLGKCLDCVREGKVFALDEEEEDALCLSDADLLGTVYPESRKWLSCSEVGCEAGNLHRIGGIESTKCLISHSALSGFTGILNRSGFPIGILGEWINQRARMEASTTRDVLFNATTILAGF